MDEGRLTYLAVHQWYGWSAGRQLILDIGGGSMEIVFGRDAEPELSLSLPLGAGRLTRAYTGKIGQAGGAAGLPPLVTASDDAR